MQRLKRAPRWMKASDRMRAPRWITEPRRVRSQRWMTAPRSMKAFFLGSIVALALVGCGKAPASRYYVMENAAGPELPSASPVVRVVRFAVASPYDRDNIAYRVGSDAVQIRFYPYDRWAVPLDEMLAALTASTFDGVAGHRFSRSEGSLAGDLRLGGHLIWLEEIDTPEGPRIRFRLDLELTGSAGGVLYRARLEGDHDAPAAEVEDIVKRMQAALLEALSAEKPRLAEVLPAAANGP